MLELLAQGKSLIKAAKESGTSASAVYDWMELNPQFAEEYAQVRARAYRMLADEIIEISDEAEVEAKYQGDDVKLDLSATAVARNRLRVDSRKWMLSKMLPKVYGDKLETTHQGVDGGPIKTESSVVISSEEAYKRMLG